MDLKSYKTLLSAWERRAAPRTPAVSYLKVRKLAPSRGSLKSSILESSDGFDADWSANQRQDVMYTLLQGYDNTSVVSLKRLIEASTENTKFTGLRTHMCVL